MNTLSDFKKALHPGVKLNTIWHNRFAGRDEQGNIIHTDEDCGIREVSIVQLLKNKLQPILKYITLYLRIV